MFNRVNVQTWDLNSTVLQADFAVRARKLHLVNLWISLVYTTVFRTKSPHMIMGGAPKKVSVSRHALRRGFSCSKGFLLYSIEYVSMISKQPIQRCLLSFQRSCDAVVCFQWPRDTNAVIDAVGPNCRVVTGRARTNWAVGGWLEGSGLSFTSRLCFD